MTSDEIKAIREKLCVSQEKFASLLGATVVSVNRWENGKTKPSRLYVKELKQLRSSCGSYTSRREELEKS